MKTIYDKPTASIIINVLKLKTCVLNSGIRQRHTLLSLLFNILLEILAALIRKEKEVEGIQSGKEEVKLPVYADDILNH